MGPEFRMEDSKDSTSLSDSVTSGTNYGSFNPSPNNAIISDKKQKEITRCERTVSKNGHCNFNYASVPKQRTKFFSDLFTTLLELKWRWTLLIFCLGYFGSWLFFGIFWYLILFFHGDTANFGNPDWSPCVTGIQNFTSAFLFSVETQHTTGYGFYHLTEQCPQAVFLFCIQSIFGVILEGLLVGLVFTKMVRARKRNKTLLFSNNAVISPRDGVLHFMFRIADMRRTHLLEAHVRAQLIRKRTTKEGEIITYHQEELRVGGDGERDDKVLMFWPTTVVHKITRNSPLYNLQPGDLSSFNQSFEIIVVLEGIVEATGLVTQARSSYLPSEILWGHRFECVVSKKSNSGDRTIDYSLFNATVPCNDLNEEEEDNPSCPNVIVTK